MPIPMFSRLYWMRSFGSVKRFHGIRLLHPDTVAHHSANVALIISELYPEASALLLKVALKHDLPEGIIGDIPASVKWAVGKEANARLDYLERETENYFGWNYELLGEKEQRVLKAADILDSCFTVLLERSSGNCEVNWVFQNYSEYILKSEPFKDLPSFEDVWFSIRTSFYSFSESFSPLDYARKNNFWRDRK